MEIKEMYPLPESAKMLKANFDTEICNILNCKSDKKLLIIGPCSADNPDAVKKYFEEIKEISEQINDRWLTVARVFTNKPRTGDGYRGLAVQPDPLKAPDPFSGLIAARRLHCEILGDIGLPTADELLYPQDYRYFSDVVSYLTVGARSVTNQEHRLVAGGAEAPVGFKNPVDGDINTMLSAVASGTKPKDFIYRGWAVRSDGNEYCHAILRGKTDFNGERKSNISADEICHLCEKLPLANPVNPAFIIDCSHDNSGRNPFNQENILTQALLTLSSLPSAEKLFKGFMIESYIYDGKCGGSEYTPGKSITDPCLGIKKTKELLLKYL